MTVLQRRPSWLRHRLWLLLATLLTVAIAVTLWIECQWLPYQQRERAIQEIKRVGGSISTEPSVGVRYLGRFLGSTVVHVDLVKSPIHDDWLKHLSHFTDLESVHLHHTQVTGVGLKHLAGLTKLHGLMLEDTWLTDAGFRHVNALTNLRAVAIRRAEK